MGIGTSIALIAIGAILKYAVTASVSGVKLEMVGVILMVAGVIGLIVSLIWMTVSSPLRRAGRIQTRFPTAVVSMVRSVPSWPSARGGAQTRMRASAVGTGAGWACRAGIGQQAPADSSAARSRRERVDMVPPRVRSARRACAASGDAGDELHVAA